MFPNGTSSRALLKLAAAALALAVATPVWAALKVGAKAPDFTTQATLAGQPFAFTLREALRKGPVVLYFYPAAFTKGCTVEAHLFAEATDEFNALGATVIGVSKDDIDTLNRFSVSECRNKFAVAADPDLAIARAYDAKVPLLSYADRTSFVILPDASVAYVHSALKPDDHVKNTLAAVKAWKARQQP